MDRFHVATMVLEGQERIGRVMSDQGKSAQGVGRETNVSSTRISPVKFHAGAWIRGSDRGGELGGQPTVYVWISRALDGANIGDLANGTGRIGRAGSIRRERAIVGRSINDDL